MVPKIICINKSNQWTKDHSVLSCAISRQIPEITAGWDKLWPEKIVFETQITNNMTVKEKIEMEMAQLSRYELMKLHDIIKLLHKDRKFSNEISKYPPPYIRVREVLKGIGNIQCIIQEIPKSSDWQCTTKWGDFWF